jgi:hypothetical protein
MHDVDGVRLAVEAVDREFSILAEQAGASGGPELKDLRATWRRLVDVLALGPAPVMRACPHCGTLGFAAATKCGKCWRPLVPPRADPQPGATP